MLSNKLTFSLVLVLMLAFVATSAMAQTVTAPAAAGDFAVIAKADLAELTGGTEETDLGTTDLQELLRFGGTIELQMRIHGDAAFSNAAARTTALDAANTEAAKYTAAMAAGASADDKKATRWNDFIITEIMWGLDDPSQNPANHQWIEIYNNAGVAHPTGGALRLAFYPNERRTADLSKASVDSGASATDPLDDSFWIIIDRVSTVNRFGLPWDVTTKGQSGNSNLSDSTDGSSPDGAGSALSNLVSMYRKIDLTGGNTYKADKIGDGTFWNDGTADGSWAGSAVRTNMNGYFIGTPFSPHLDTPGGVTKYAKDPATVASEGVIINEVRNDTSEANLDWIELFYNTTATAATSKSVDGYQLSIVTSNSNEDPLATLPAYKMQPGEYLVVYNRDPGKTVKLAGGVNLQDVIDGKHVNKGATHKYVVDSRLNLPSTGKFLILLRSENKTNHEKVVDYAGNGFFKADGTDVYPLKGWSAPGDYKAEDGFGDNTFASMSMSYGRTAELKEATGEYGAKSRENRVHHEDWEAFDFRGAGYDRGRDKTVDPMTSPGTPGYPNVAVNLVSNDKDTTAGTDDYAFSGNVSISEIMYDAGPRWNLVQWIELYNSSMTETIDIAGWELEIRNEATDIETYVDSIIEFADDTLIPPNQTLLVVSSTGTNDVPSNYVYNLTENHPRELGVRARGKRLLSNTGFHLTLRAKVNLPLMVDDKSTDHDERKMMVVDEVGNVTVKGAARIHQWDLPADDPSNIRKSIVRVYGTLELDGSPDNASDGTMASSWRQSDLAGAGLTFYGHRDDISTPGYRLGGPLPVSLSSFRPVRDDATGHVVVRWVTQSELNNAGFNILRSETKNGEFKVVNVKGIVPGHGTTSEKHVYEWTDTSAKPNVVYYYQIEDVSLNGERTTLTTTRLKGHVSAAGKLTTTWSRLKQRN